MALKPDKEKRIGLFCRKYSLYWAFILNGSIGYTNVFLLSFSIFLHGSPFGKFFPSRVVFVKGTSYPLSVYLRVRYSILILKEELKGAIHGIIIRQSTPQIPRCYLLMT